MAKTYNPAKVAVSFAGFPLSGFGDTFISAERNEDAFAVVIGADGEASRVANANKSGRVTITLKQTSLSNDVLSNLAVADELGNLSTGALMVKDVSGTTVLLAQEAWIVKRPTVEFGKEGSDREWILETGNLEIFSGGNL